MVKPCSLLTLALSVALVACTTTEPTPAVPNTRVDDGCTVATEFEPALCPLRLPEIGGVTVTRNALKSPLEKDAAVNCGAFVLTPELVRRYLDAARIVDAADAHRTLDWSPCSAAGRLSLAGGRRAEWTINQHQGGTLRMEGGAVLTLYCPSCRFKPFLWGDSTAPR